MSKDDKEYCVLCYQVGQWIEANFVKREKLVDYYQCPFCKYYFPVLREPNKDENDRS